MCFRRAERVPGDMAPEISCTSKVTWCLAATANAYSPSPVELGGPKALVWKPGRELANGASAAGAGVVETPLEVRCGVPTLESKR